MVARSKKAAKKQPRAKAAIAQKPEVQKPKVQKTKSGAKSFAKASPKTSSKASPKSAAKASPAKKPSPRPAAKAALEPQTKAVAKAAPVQEPQTQEKQTSADKQDFYGNLTAIQERKRLALIERHAFEAAIANKKPGREDKQ